MKYLMCNLKSNKTLKEILEYKSTLKNLEFNNTEFVLFPSSIYLSFFYDANYKIGSQTVSNYPSGSITGEIMPQQLKSLKVSYCLINHAEAKETVDEVINKIKNITKLNIKAVLCIGEREKQTMDETIIEIKNKLKEILPKLNNKELENIIFAYEPSWAINSNSSVNPEVISNIIKKLKKELKSVYNIEPSILYGGGVNDKSINELIKYDNIDGYLVGNYAINPDNICKLLSKF